MFGAGLDFGTGSNTDDPFGSRRKTFHHLSLHKDLSKYTERKNSVADYYIPKSSSSRRASKISEFDLEGMSSSYISSSGVSRAKSSRSASYIKNPGQVGDLNGNGNSSSKVSRHASMINTSRPKGLAMKNRSSILSNRLDAKNNNTNKDTLITPISEKSQSSSVLKSDQDQDQEDESIRRKTDLAVNDDKTSKERKKLYKKATGISLAHSVHNAMCDSQSTFCTDSTNQGSSTQNVWDNNNDEENKKDKKDGRKNKKRMRNAVVNQSVQIIDGGEDDEDIFLLCWAPTNEYNQNRIPLSRQKKTDEILTINISGHIFQCWRSTLEKFPDTLLGSDDVRKHFFDPERKEYFFDRDPEIFRHILNYYRSGRLHYPRTDCIGCVDDELAFFGISQDIIADCCYEDYRDRKREYIERTVEDRIEDKNKQAEVVNLPLRQRMWNAFESPHSNTSALVFYYVTGFFIAVSVTANIIETLPWGPGAQGSLPVHTLGQQNVHAFQCLDTACVLIFTFEYVARLYAAPCRVKGGRVE